MCHKTKNDPLIKKGNYTQIDPSETIIPQNLMYSVTAHNRKPQDETNVPIPDEENTVRSKEFVDDNHLD